MAKKTNNEKRARLDPILEAIGSVINRKDKPVTQPVYSPPTTSPPPVVNDNKQQEEEKPKDTTKQFYTDVNTGGYSGVQVGDRTYLGKLSDEEVAGIQQKEAAKQQLRENITTVEQAQALQYQQQQGALLAGQVGQGQNQLLNNIQATPRDYGQALGAGLTSTVPGVVGGAVAGAAAGLATGGVASVPLAIGGALLGGIGSFIVGVRSSLNQQMSEGLTVGTQSLKQSRANLKALITDTNRNPQNAAANLEMYNYQISLINQAHSQLKLDTQRNLDKWLGKDGRAQLEQYELFNSGTKQLLDQRMQMALLNPDPSKIMITMDDIGVEDE